MQPGRFHGGTKYSFTDEVPLNGLSYYRLKQTDLDGKSKTFQVITIHRSFSLYPNPAGNEMVFFSEKANVIIYDYLRQIIMELQSAESLDASNLPAGVYVVKNHEGEFARLIKK